MLHFHMPSEGMEKRLRISIGMIGALVIPQVVGPAVNLNGLTPPYSPNFTINMGASQTLSLASGARLVARIDTHHESTAYAQFDHAIGTKIKAFWRTDASITFTPKIDNISLTAWVRNIENKAQVTIAGSGGIPGPGAQVVERPRKYGLRIGYNF